MKWTKEQIAKQKVQRAYRLDFLEWIDNLIKNLAMPNKMKDKLKEIRANSCRYTTNQLKEMVNKILDNNQL